MATSLLIGYESSNGRDTEVLIVGKQGKNGIEIINAFQGDEARELYLKLVTKKVKPDER